MKDHATIYEYLKDIDRRELINLGAALGLEFPKVQRMQYIPEDMVAAWLRREDHVLEKSGEPTRQSLVNSLQKIGQRGVAKSIQDDLLWSNNVSKSDDAQFRGNIMVSQSILCRSRMLMPMLILTVAILLSLYFIGWPTLIYKFNLDFHSKTLPYSTPHFFGREKELANITNLLSFHNSDIRIVCIIGSPGFGKFTLAIHVGHEMVKRNIVVH